MHLKMSAIFSPPRGFIARTKTTYPTLYKNISVIHHTICGAVWFQLTNFCCDDWENIYIYYVLLSLSNQNLFRVRSWKNGVRWMSFFIFIYIYTLSFITFHIISYIVSYLIILHIIYHNIISHHIMLYHIPYHTIAYNTITYHLKYPITSYSISYHTSYHFFISKWNIINYILYHFISGNWEYLFKFGIF